MIYILFFWIINSFKIWNIPSLKSVENSFDIEIANQKAKDFIVAQDIEKLDYFEFRNNHDLSFNGKVSASRLFYAIYKGKIRLIDNLKI